MMFFSSFGIFGEQQNFQIGFDRGHARFQLSEFVLGVGAHLGIFFVDEHRFALGDALGQIFVLAIFFDDGRDLGMGLGSLLVSRRVVDDLRRGESAVELVVAGFDLVQTFKHGSFQFSVLGSQLNHFGSRLRSRFPRKSLAEFRRYWAEFILCVFR